jgi:hypothetical protein
MAVLDAVPGVRFVTKFTSLTKVAPQCRRILLGERYYGDIVQKVNVKTSDVHRHGFHTINASSAFYLTI